MSNNSLNCRANVNHQHLNYSYCDRAETLAPHAQSGLWRLVVRVQMAEM